MVLVRIAVLEKIEEKHQQKSIFLKVDLKKGVGENAETIGI